METISDLKSANKELKSRLAEAEQTLHAIRDGEVDALIAAGPRGDQVFTLEGAETPYRILIEEMSQGALMLTADGTVLYANARFAFLAKTPLEQIIGTSWQRFFSVEEYARVQACLKTVGPCAPADELSLLAADGSATPVHLSLRSMSTIEAADFFVIVTDLTERKASEDALRKTSDQLLDNNKKLEAFSYSISHDMRAPLRAMQSFGKILIDEYQHQLEPEPRSYLVRIVACAEQLDRLIHDVLTYSRLTSDDSDAATFDLDRMMREMIETYPHLRAANIELIRSQAQVRGYAVPLGQCILNLLSNAIKFVPADRAPVIKVWTETSNGHLRLWVQDNGIGILLKDQERIFDTFTRINSQAEFEGTGLGLSMVKTAVEKMGGRVGVQSELGQGSRFWIELPTAEH
jgi:PAS domain S-box-containing protein